MKYFDLHNDTLGYAYNKNCDPFSEHLQYQIGTTAGFYDEVSQVFALYSRKEQTEERCWQNFLTLTGQMMDMKFPSNLTPYLAVEGGKLLDGKISRMRILAERGVCLLTLVWGGHCSVGGAHDDGRGLSEFGFKVLEKCKKYGIIIDVSHASDGAFWQVAEFCSNNNLPFIASHSNSRAVCNHTRNLTDEMFTAIVKSGGIVGISLCAPHVTRLCAPHAGANKNLPDSDDVLLHIERYFSLNGGKNVCFGCDYDGIDAAPTDLAHPKDLIVLRDKMRSRGFSYECINDIFYDNAARFFIKNKVRKFR